MKNWICLHAADFLPPAGILCHKQCGKHVSIEMCDIYTLEYFEVNHHLIYSHTSDAFTQQDFR